MAKSINRLSRQLSRQHGVILFSTLVILSVLCLSCLWLQAQQLDLQRMVHAYTRDQKHRVDLDAALINAMDAFQQGRARDVMKLTLFPDTFSYTLFLETIHQSDTHHWGQFILKRCYDSVCDSERLGYCVRQLTDEKGRLSVGCYRSVRPPMTGD